MFWSLWFSMPVQRRLLQHVKLSTAWNGPLATPKCSVWTSVSRRRYAQFCFKRYRGSYFNQQSNRLLFLFFSPLAVLSHIPLTLQLDFHKGLLTGEDPRAVPAPNRPAAPPPLMPPTREKEREREREREGATTNVRDQWAEREREMERRERTRSEREWDRDKVRDFTREERETARRSRSRDRERRRKERGKSKEKKSEKKGRV